MNISNAQSPHVAVGYHTGQHRCRTSLPPQKILLVSAGTEGRKKKINKNKKYIYQMLGSPARIKLKSIHMVGQHAGPIVSSVEHIHQNK